MEVEDKYHVPEGAHLPRLQEIPGVWAVEQGAEELLEATYFDTEDLCLAAFGLTLRRRTGGLDEGWHLKVPTADGRCEVEEPLGAPGSPIPTHLLDVIAALTAERAVGPIAVLRTRRRGTRLLNKKRQVLAVVADDRVAAQALPSSDRSTEMRWREWEVELVHADRPLLKDTARLLVSHGASPAQDGSKLARLLGDRVRPPFGHQDNGVHLKGPASDVVRRRVVEQVTEILRADPQVRLDLPDAVHRMRVAVRRLRSALAGYRPLLDREVTDPIREELRWLAAALGEPRDAEVLQARVRVLLREQDPALADLDTAAFVDAVLTQRHRDKHRHLVVTELGSARYRRLLETLSGLAGDPPLLEAAAEPARDVLPVLVRRDWKRLESKVEAAQVATDPLTRQARLHGVRRAAKRVRYGLEPLTALYGRRARRLLEAAIDIQTVLGDQHDAVVVLKNLRELSYRASESGVNAFTLGALHSQEHARAARRSAEFDRVWARAARPKLRHWLS